MTNRFEIPETDLLIDFAGELTAELIEREEYRAASTCPECGTDHSDPEASTYAPICDTCNPPTQADFDRIRDAFERDHRAGMAYS